MEVKSENKFKNDDLRINVDPSHDPLFQADSIELNEIHQAESPQISFDVFDFEILRLINCHSLAQLSSFIGEKIEESSVSCVEAIFGAKIEEINYEDFIQIQEIFNIQSFNYLLIKSNDNLGSLLFWRNRGQEQIFVLDFKDEEEEISLYVRKFLMASQKSGHDGLLSSFKYDRTHAKVDVKLFSLGDARDYDLLSIAAESGDVEAVRILLKLGFDVHVAVDGVTAMDLAYERKNFGVMLELLKNHALYPDNFSTDGISDELKTFIKLSKLMHESIQDKKKEKVLEILDQNPKSKFYYDTDNNSALTYAILNESFEIYEIFLIRNFVFGPKENIDEILDELDEKAQRKLKSIHEKHSKGLIQKHLMILLANTSVGHDNENDPEKIAAITLAYQTLDKDPRLSQILKVVAASRNFKITFDFERDSVRILDPSVEGYANGLFTTSGKILVAAQDLMSEEYKHITYGVLAHELCHFALYGAFENDAKPYRKDDVKGKETYDEIILDCINKKDHEEIVDSVFEYYPTAMFAAELAVRYAHMLGHYHNEPDEIAEKSTKFESLKTFHEEKVMPVLNQAIEKFEAKADFKGKYKHAKKTISTMRKVIFVLLALVCLSSPLIYFFAQGPTKVWKDLDQNEKELIKNNFVNFRGVEVRFGDLFDDNSTAFDDLNPQQIAEGLEKNSKGINEAFNSILYLKVFLVWKNCTKPLKNKILNASINFQGEKVELKKVLDFDSPPLYKLDSYQIKSLIEDRELTLSTKFAPPTSFFIDRRFKIVSTESYKEKIFKSKNLRNEEKIERLKHSRLNVEIKDAIGEVFREGIFFLSDGSGSGKSTVFKHFPRKLKEARPDFWVAFVTIKDNAEVFKKLQTFRNFSSLIGEKILKLEGLELSVFKELFDKGKVAFVWDAFDEVKVESRDHLLNALKIIKIETENLNFLSSRPEHQKTITEALSAKALKLVPFDLKDRENFFTESLKNLSKAERETIKEKIQNFIEKSQEGNSVEDRTINNPLMLHILSEVLKNDKNVNLKNRYEIYQKFVEKQINTIDPSRILTLTHKGLNFKNIHKAFALNGTINEILIFNDTIKISLQIMRQIKSLNATEIAEFGLMMVTNDNRLQFIHKTFEYFFVASFLAEDLYNFDEVISEEEWKSRIRIFYFILMINDEQVLNFLFDFLKFSPENFYPLNEQIFKVFEKILRNDFVDSLKSLLSFDFLSPRAEIIRRLLLRDSKNFQFYFFNDENKNSFNWLKQKFQIDAKSMEILQTLNDSKLIIEEYKENHQMANIFFKIWFHYNRGEISLAHLINNCTGLNLDPQSLKEFGNQENVQQVFKFIAENSTQNKEEEKKLFRINFEEIFFTFNVKDEIYWELWKNFEENFSKEEFEKILFKLLHRAKNIFDVITKMKNSTIVELMLKEVEKFAKFNSTWPEIWQFPTKNACKNNFQVLKVYWRFIKKFNNEAKFNSFCSSEEILLVLQNGKAVEGIKNIYEFYEEVFDTQIELKNKTEKREKIKELHQKAALDSVPIEKYASYLKEQVEKLKSEVREETLSMSSELTSIGFVSLFEQQFQFESKTFEDFFIANYFAENLFLGSSDKKIIYSFTLPIALVESKNVELFLQKFLIKFHGIKDWKKDYIFLEFFLTFIFLVLQKKKENQIKESEAMKRFLLEIETKNVIQGLLEVFSAQGLEIKNYKNLKVFDWLKKDFKIEVANDDENEKFNDTNKIFETYERNNQEGNIFFKIWFYYRRDEYSSSYLINKYTGLNLDDKILTEIGEQENFFDFYNFVSQNLTEKDKAKMFEMNFEEIFLVDYENGEKYWKAWQKLTESVKSNETTGKLLQKSNKRQENILHIIAKISEPKIVETMLNEVKKYLEKEYLQLLIKSSTIYKEFPTFYACNNQAEVLKVFWNFITKYLKPEEQKFHLLCEIRGESNFYEACRIKESFREIVTKEEAQSADSSFCENRY